MKTKAFLSILCCTGIAVGLHAQYSWNIATGTFFTPVDNPVAKTNYQLIFNDEFNETTFAHPPYQEPNTTLWNVQNYYQDGNHNGTHDPYEIQSIMVDDWNHHAAENTYTRESCPSSWNPNNKCIVINLRHQAPPATMNSQFEYTTGAFESQQNFKHGYFEMRCKLPTGQLTWPAFWLFYNESTPLANYDHSRGAEIDIFEIFGNHISTDGTNIHFQRLTSCTVPGGYGCGDVVPNSNYTHHCFARDITLSSSPSQLDFSEAFHTFGLEWTTNSIDFYLDNILIRSVSNNCYVPDVISKVIANMALAYDGYGGMGNAANNTYPQKMLIDYIRVYKKIDLTKFGSDASAGSWSAEYPRVMADVNGDGKDDVVGFGLNGVYVSLAAVNPTTGKVTFVSYYPWINKYGYSYNTGSWRINEHIRTLKDMNNDGKADIVGFGTNGVYVSLSNGVNGFSAPALWINNFGSGPAAGGWSLSLHERYLADVNGDQFPDVVGFGGAGVYVALNNGSNAFSTAVLWTNNYGNDANAGGWSNAYHARMVGDVNGDGKADVVGCGGSQVFVSLSTGTGLFTASSQLMINNNFCFGSSPSWDVNNHRRMLADVNGDGKDDLVGFGVAGVYVSRATTNSNQALRFSAPVLSVTDFGSGLSAGSWNPNDHIRTMADMNGDGLSDVIGYGESSVYVAYAYNDSWGQGFRWPFELMNWYCHAPASGGFLTGTHPRMTGDVNGDGLQDLVAFGANGLFITPSRKCGNCDDTPGSTYRLANPDVTDTQQEVRQDEMQLFPNPTTGSFTVRLSGEGEHHIIVYDLVGRMISEKTITANECTFELKGEPAGIYIVRVESAGKVQTKKLLLQ